MKRLFIFCILWLISLTLHAQRFALLDFQLGTNVTAEEVDALGYNFRANFFIDGYRDIPSAQINSTIESFGFNRSDMTRQQMLRLGRELAAKLVVVGTINKLMDEYTVEVNALDVSTGLTCATEGATFVKNEYRTAMETLADNLAEKLGNYDLADSKADISSSSQSSQMGSSKVGYVDLGLSVKWATCNLGAHQPEEYGDYYAWGETEIKMTYDWSVYKWSNGSSSSLTKYNTNSSLGRVDHKTVLDPADDVAKVKLGGSWRMPSDTEWTELRTKCTWTWTTQSGVNGYRVTSKINGNSIFLPVAGFRLNSDPYIVGISGYYWSSSLDTDSPYRACYVCFYFGEVGRGYYYRFVGQSVRPVSE